MFNKYFERIKNMKIVLTLGFAMKQKNWEEKFMRKRLYRSVSLVLAAFLLFALIGCNKGKTEKAPEQSAEQKISQLQTFPLPKETNDLDLTLEKSEDKGGIWAAAGWAAIDGQDSVNASKFFVLQSQNKTYIFDTFSFWKRTDVTQVYKLNRDDAGFNVQIPKDKIENGEYRAGIIIKKGNLTSFQYFPGKTIKF